MVDDVSSKNFNGLGFDFLLGYYKDRYDETRVSYRRLEDKANYLMAFIGLEVSALLVISGAVNFDSSKYMTLSFVLFLLSVMVDLSLIICCFYFLWRTWRLKSFPKMPIEREKEKVDFLLDGDPEKLTRYFLVLYSQAIGDIEILHEEKARHVSHLTLGIACSFIFFVLSISFLFLNRI